AGGKGDHLAPVQIAGALEMGHAHKTKADDANAGHVLRSVLRVMLWVPLSALVPECPGTGRSDVPACDYSIKSPSTKLSINGPRMMSTVAAMIRMAGISILTPASAATVSARW